MNEAHHPTGSGESRPAFEPGTVLANRFRIERVLGDGGMGIVYLAADTTLGNQRVALKTILPKHDRDGIAVQRFKREVQYARMITHQNVCRVFDVGHHDVGDPDGPVIFVTMEYLQGETLWSFLQESGPLLPAQALPIVRQLADGLAAAHAAEIIHRDFKSPNVMLVPGKNGPRVVITDFGLARLTEASNFDAHLTRTGSFVGSPLYIAPEQIEGGTITPATDVFAFGVVLYEMLTGKFPYVASTPFATAMRRLHEPPTPPRAYLPSIDPQWENAILRCLARAPEDRYASVGDLMRALQPVVVSLPPEASTVPAPPPPPRRRSRGKWIGGGAAALMAILAIYLWISKNQGLAPTSSAGQRMLAQTVYAQGKYVQARRLLEAAAAGGDAEAELRLGKLLTMCVGGPCDFPRAEKLLQRAAARDSREAEAWLAQVLTVNRPNDPRTLELARSAAEEGEVVAQMILARAYETGEGVTKDAAEANRYYELALPKLREMADSEDPYGENALANLYLHDLPGQRKNEAKAIELYRRAAQRDYPVAQMNLGGLYNGGSKTLKKDESKALFFYQKAADRGHPRALFTLGYCYDAPCFGLTKDEVKAALLYQKAADQGSIDAMNNLATMYHSGSGRQKDLAKAAELYRKAADEGDPYGQTNLGLLYEDGHGGLPKDDTKAVELYIRAGNQGHLPARYALGRMYEDGRGGLPKDEQKALDLFRAAGDIGLYRLGRMYALGLGGLQKDEVEAVKLYRRAAELGDKHAQHVLGERYDLGLGLPKDDVQAVKFYREAALQDYAPAQRNLGKMYAAGRGGLVQSDTMAMQWYQKAADGGDASAQYSLAHFYDAAQHGLVRNEVKAAELYRKAADQGHREAQNNLGCMYDVGRGGLPKDSVKAMELFRASAAQGNVVAHRNLAVFYEHGRDGVPKDLANALKWYRSAADLGDESAKKSVERLSAAK